jgi:hypothetical protein
MILWTHLGLGVLDREKMAAFLASLDFHKLVEFQHTAFTTEVSLEARIN